MGAIMDVGGWLRSLGLGQYEAAFRANEIDETVLPSLTAEDLKELGVAALGHRRKLLDAIAQIFRHEAVKPAYSRGHAFVIARNDLAQILRVHARGECRRTDQVGEHYRDLATLGGIPDSFVG